MSGDLATPVRTFSHGCSGGQPRWSEGRSAPLICLLGVVPAEDNFSGLFINVLFGPFEAIVQLFRENYQNLPLARHCACYGTTRHIWCPAIHGSGSCHSSRFLRPWRSRMEIFPSIRISQALCSCADLKQLAGCFCRRAIDFLLDKGQL